MRGETIKYQSGDNGLESCVETKEMSKRSLTYLAVCQANTAQCPLDDINSQVTLNSAVAKISFLLDLQG